MTEQKLMEEINALSVPGNCLFRFQLIVWNEWEFEKVYECHDIDTVAGLLFELSLSHGVFRVGCSVNIGGLYSVTLNLHSLPPNWNTNLDSESIGAVLGFLKMQWGG